MTTLRVGNAALDTVETSQSTQSATDPNTGDAAYMEAREYAKALGENLRKIRQQKGMSLQDVQAASRGEWKAAVIGAYERGDRNVTVGRLHELADFYDVPISELLPEAGDATPVHTEQKRRVVLDLDSLEKVPATDREPIHRFMTAIQLQRGDFNGRVLTIREDDLMPLALMYQTSADELARRLASWGMLGRTA